MGEDHRRVYHDFRRWRQGDHWHRRFEKRRAVERFVGPAPCYLYERAHRAHPWQWHAETCISKCRGFAESFTFAVPSPAPQHRFWHDLAGDADDIAFSEAPGRRAGTFCLLSECERLGSCTANELAFPGTSGPGCAE